MIRGVVHRPPVDDKLEVGFGRSHKLESRGFPGKMGVNLRTSRLSDGQPPSDGYLQTLVKYVPVEVTAAFVLLSILASHVSRWAVLGVAALCLVATPLQVWIRDRQQDASSRTRPFFYLLAFIAFPCWALLVSQPLRELLGVKPAWAELAVGVSAFAIPLIDKGIDTLRPRAESTAGLGEDGD